MQATGRRNSASGERVMRRERWGRGEEKERRERRNRGKGEKWKRAESHHCWDGPNTVLKALF